jgi:hypothetical protein
MSVVCEDTKWLVSLIKFTTFNGASEQRPSLSFVVAMQGRLLIVLICSWWLERAYGSCVLRTVAECESLCDDELFLPENSFVEAIHVVGQVADFRCANELRHIQVACEE